MNDNTIAALNAAFDESRVKTKKVPGRPDASYLESYDVINKANEVFGYGGWGTEIKSLELRETGGKTLCYVVVELTAEGCLPRQDVGVNVAAQKQGQPLAPEALETSIKGAVSDAMKRAFRHYGKQFGNDLYDKERDGGNGKQPAQKPAAKVSKPAAQPSGGKVSSDAMSVLWLYAKENDFAPEYVQGVLANNEGDPTKALVILKEQRDEA